MTPYTVATIVEGHGECSALPILLRSLRPEWRFPRPIRGKRQRLLIPDTSYNLEHYLPIARTNIEANQGSILVVIDADNDCAATLGPELLRRAQRVVRDVSVNVVLPTRTFEAWFIGGQAVATDQPGDADSLPSPKSTVRNALGGTYSETVDMPKLTAGMDIHAAEMYSPSFSKLVRDLGKLGPP